MSKWISRETFNLEVKDAFRKYLRDNNIYYELSACFDGWHFEIKIENEIDMERIDWFEIRLNEYMV